MRDKLVRVGIRAILKDPARRRELGVRFIMACQEMEGRDADRAAAERAYDTVIAERQSRYRDYAPSDAPDQGIDGQDDTGCRRGCDLVDPHERCIAHNGADLGPRPRHDHGDDERRSSQGK